MKFKFVIMALVALMVAVIAFAMPPPTSATASVEIMQSIVTPATGISELTVNFDGIAPSWTANHFANGTLMGQPFADNTNFTPDLNAHYFNAIGTAASKETPGQPANFVRNITSNPPDGVRLWRITSSATRRCLPQRAH